MADLGSVESDLRGVADASLKKTLVAIFTKLVPDIRFGHPKGEQPDPAKNLGGGFFQGTTPSVANTAFSITHDFGRTPYLAVPVLPLDQVNSQTPRLKVTKAADTKRVYFSSPDTSMAFTVYIEG